MAVVRLRRTDSVHGRASPVGESPAAEAQDVRWHRTKDHDRGWVSASMGSASFWGPSGGHFLVVERRRTGSGRFTGFEVVELGAGCGAPAEPATRLRAQIGVGARGPRASFGTARVRAATSGRQAFQASLSLDRWWGTGGCGARGPHATSWCQPNPRLLPPGACVLMECGGCAPAAHGLRPRQRLARWRVARSRNASR